MWSLWPQLGWNQTWRSYLRKLYPALWITYAMERRTIRTRKRGGSCELPWGRYSWFHSTVVKPRLWSHWCLFQRFCASLWLLCDLWGAGRGQVLNVTRLATIIIPCLGTLRPVNRKRQLLVGFRKASSCLKSKGDFHIRKSVFFSKQQGLSYRSSVWSVVFQQISTSKHMITPVALARCLQLQTAGTQDKRGDVYLSKKEVPRAAK